MFKAKFRHSAGNHLVGTLVLVACAIGAGLLYFNRQLIVDTVTAWQYTPSQEIAAIAERSKMSGTGKLYFYASHPTLETAEKFNQTCKSAEASTAILGCYNGQNIFIYNVTDTKLDGIREVTAAHEMLHVAYARLSDSERRRVNALLDEEYIKIKDNKDYAERMAFYARTEPGERENELHSIIGTEVDAVSTELGEYYKRFFDDRGAVVGLYSKYQSVFTNLQKQGDSIAQQLTSLEQQIETASTQYNADVNQLNDDIESFNARANSGGFSSNQQFQAERQRLLARAEALNDQRNAINADIDQYNRLRDELMSIASQSDALNRSINSSLAPAPSL